MGKLLALDYGQKRIGVAVSDAEQRYSFARPPVVVSNVGEQLSAIAKLVRSEAIEQIIIGLPVNLNGKETDQTRTVRIFADRLAAAAGVPIEFRDERLTTKQGQKLISDDRTGRLDSQVAKQLLEEYLEQRSRS